MMCCATGLPVPDWVRGMCAPVPRSSTHTTGVLLVLNQRRTRQWSQTDDGAGTLSLDFQNTHPSVIIRYPFRALLHANLFPRARVAAPRLGTQVTDLLRRWNLDCVSAVCLRLESRPHPRHPCPTDCNPFRQHSSRRARPNARPPRSRAPAFGFPSSALAAAPVPKRGPLRVAQYPACSVCLGQYVGVTGLCCSAQRRPGALTWPRAERTKPAAL